MSSKDVSVAPKERINIKYVPSVGDQKEEMELPLKLLVVGDFKGGTEETSIEDRKAISIDKNTFQKVMKESQLTLTTSVKNTLSTEEDATLPVKLSFKHLTDFSPDSIARQIPELKKLIELREALVALKGPLGNIPAFRKRLQSLLISEESKAQLMAELKIIDEGAERSEDAAEITTKPETE